jgi:hypothetical protein
MPKKDGNAACKSVDSGLHGKQEDPILNSARAQGRKPGNTTGLSESCKKVISAEEEVCRGVR